MPTFTNPLTHNWDDRSDLLGPIENPNVKRVSASYVVGAPGATVNCAVTLKYGGAAMTESIVTWNYLATSAAGTTVASAPSGAVAIGTNGLIIVSPTAKLVHLIKSTAGGLFDINVANSGAYTAFLITVIPHFGAILASPAITTA